MDQTGGFAYSPYVPFRDGIVRVVKTGSEVAVAFTFVPSYEVKAYVGGPAGAQWCAELSGRLDCRA